jgi:DNA-binding CsgD family transcriptional regulator
VSASDREHLWATAPSAVSSNPYQLTVREFDVARMLGRGLGLAEIAETLGLSGRSVLAQRERLMEKLGARNLAHLEHIIATLERLDSDWSESVYLDDFSDGLADEEEPDLIFAD